MNAPPCLRPVRSSIEGRGLMAKRKRVAKVGGKASTNFTGFEAFRFGRGTEARLMQSALERRKKPTLTFSHAMEQKFGGRS